VPRLSEGAIAISVVRLTGTDLDDSIKYNTLIEQRLLAEFPDEIAHVWSRIGSAEIATDPMGIELTDTFMTLKPRNMWKKAKSQAALTTSLSTICVICRTEARVFAADRDADQRDDLGLTR
jgi:cobalt-zinc-cadmium resistance protein CzcA